MMTWKSFGRAAAVLLLAESLFTPAVLASGLFKVTNVSPSPLLTNEFYITATNITVSINGTNVRALVYKDTPPGGGGAPGGLPGPLIEATVGQVIVCHFRNSLTNNLEGATIHWHGLELDNDSDGTAVTQDTILPGQTYTYRFVVPRPGVYWYHSHMLPGTTTFGGMYGPIIVKDANEAALVAANVLPPTNRTFPLVLSDISFTNGGVGKVYNGTNFSLNTLIQLCENSTLGHPNADGGACGQAGFPGDVFLCNGFVPARTGTFCTPTTNSAPVFYIGKNQRVRLQLINASVSRNTYLTLRYPCSNPSGNTNLYQVGGQGGLLDSAILTGGVQSGYDFQYPRGTVNLGSGMRTDVMFYSSGNQGDVIQLVGNKLPFPWRLSGALLTNYPVAFFVITNGGSTNLPLAVGSPILTAVGAANENLRLLNTNSLALPPSTSQGTSSGVVEFKNGIPNNGVLAGPTIGDYAATPLDGNSGYGSWPDVPHPPTALWARAGTVLQLAIANNTGTDGGGGAAVHPYHLHGFSMQPVSIYSANMQTNLYNFPYNHFVDTYDILPDEALVFRIKLEDRPILADTATGGPVTLATSADTGGGLGRWLMHCHIFLHGAIGMISELVVVPNRTTRLVSSAAGTNSVIAAVGSGVPWNAAASNSWLHVTPGDTSGTGPSVVLFTYDANPGPTRFGTLNIAGQTVEVTQAGTTYVQAPGPLTGLVTNGINAPFGIAADENGNVFFADSGNGVVKKWTRTNNAVSSILSGLSSPYGLGLDSEGNVYVAQYGSTQIRKRFAPNPPVVVTLFTNDSTGVAGLTLDSAGNVYITDPGNHKIKKWTASTGTLSSYTTNGLISPWGVAVDKTGAIYASDVGDDSVKRLGFIVKFIGGFPVLVQNWNTLTTLSNLSSPYNLTLDDGGNIFIADYGHGAIKKFSAASNTVTTVVSGVGAPTSVAVDSAGNLFVSDWSGDAIREQPYAYVDPTPKFEPAEVTVDALPVVLPPTINLLPPFAPVDNQGWISSLSNTNGIVKFTVSANPGAPRAGIITLLGTNITINQAGATFALGTTNLLIGPAAGSNTITAAVVPAINIWNASTPAPWLHLPAAAGTGTTNILFTFDANPGATRTGTITVNGQVVTITQAGSTYVKAPGPLTTLVNAGLQQPTGVAVDLFGDVIFSDTGNDAIKKWTPAGNSVSTLTATGLDTPQSVAVDPAGNIYIADFFSQEIKKRRASDGVLTTLVDDSPNSPTGVSLDSATNVYWSGPTDDTIKKRLAASGSVVTVLATNLSGPYGLDVDVAGAIFIADTHNNAIKKWNPVTSSLTTVGTNGINTPWNVAVDGSGNVYVANGGSNSIVKWDAASRRFVTLVATGLSTPTGVNVDAHQNVYIADFGNNAVKELPHAYVDATTKFEPATAGSDSLPVVLPLGQSLAAPYAPTVSEPWLTITSTAGGVVAFDYEANTNTSVRVAIINLFGRNVFVQQEGIVLPTVFTDISMLTNGVFQMSFTNGVRAGIYSVLFTTNLMVPTTNWTVIGTATNNGAGLWQFTDTSASNHTRFYRIRSP